MDGVVKGHCRSSLVSGNVAGMSAQCLGASARRLVKLALERLVVGPDLCQERAGGAEQD